MYFEPVGLGNVINGRSCHRFSLFGKRSSVLGGVTGDLVSWTRLLVWCRPDRDRPFPRLSLLSYPGWAHSTCFLRRVRQPSTLFVPHYEMKILAADAGFVYYIDLKATTFSPGRALVM